MELTFKQIEKISKALGDMNRLKILNFLSGKGGCGECSDLHEVVDLAQPSISHHVKILADCGLIDSAKEDGISGIRSISQCWRIISAGWKG